MQALNGKGIVEFEDFLLDTDKNVLRRRGEVVSLPLKAVELLGVLVESRGDVVTKEELMARVWTDAFVEDSVLTQNIYLLRKTLNASGARDLIKTVPRRGYFFNGEIRDPNSHAPAVLERHLVEKITVDIDEEEPSGRPGVRGRWPVILPIVVFSILIAAAGYFYYQYDSPKAATETPQLKLGPHVNASGYKSLAVLPFEGPDEQFGKSFSADLAVRLGSVNKFAVFSPASLEERARHGADVKTDFAIKGRLEAKPNAYAAKVTFVDASGGGEIWSETFEFPNLIQLQDAIANRAAKEIFARLTEPERELIAKRLPSNIAAYDSFQKGHAQWRSRAGGTEHLTRAIELDRSFAPAYAILASAVAMGGVKDSPSAVEAQKLLDTAFSLDEHLADAYAVQGFIRMFHHRDWPGAEQSLQSALQLDPNNVNAHHWLAVFYSIHRRLDEAKAEMQKALELDPANPTFLADLGQLHYFAGENEAAREYCERALAITPGHGLARSYLALIDAPETKADPETLSRELNNAIENDSFAAPYINVDPRYAPLRNEPRFRKALRKMNL